MTDLNDPAEAPLDPATERLRRKMVRLLAVSIGVMLIGVMSVLAAVVYRTSTADGVASGEDAAVPFAIPAGASVEESALDAERVLLRLALANGGSELVIFDRRTGQILSRHPLVSP